MLQLLVLLSVPFVIEATDSEDLPILRITNGLDAAIGTLPFLASILQKEDHACGGSIIARKAILTAAHCCFDLSTEQRFEPEDLLVSVGSLVWREGKIHEVKNAIPHAGFQLGSSGNDVAVLVLVIPIEYSPIVQPVKLNPIPMDNRPLRCITAGWGYRMFHGVQDTTTEHQLQYVEVLTIPFEECQQRMATLSVKVDFGYICVYTGEGKGTCNADSGAPLIHEDKQIGILSSGVDCSNTMPEFYTKVSDYYGWIRAVERRNRVYM